MDTPLEISVAEVHRLRCEGADMLLVDCREPDEHALCAIDGAKLVPIGELADRLSEVAGDEGRRVVVFCHRGGRSLRAARWLREQGLAAAQSMAGGIDQWAIEVDPALSRY